MAAIVSLHTSIILPSKSTQSPLIHNGLHSKLIPFQCIKVSANLKFGTIHIRTKTGASHRKLVVLAVTEGSAKSSSSNHKIPSWAEPDSDEPPPWARDDGNKSPSWLSFEIPSYGYLLASTVAAIAAVGSIFEYTNRRPVFGIVNSESVFYAPLLGLFVFIGIPASVFLWLKSVQAGNKEAEEQDRRDGYS